MFAALSFLALSAFALYSSWEAAIPILVVVSVASVLIMNAAVRTGLPVDRDADAIERMLLENEKDYEPTLTGIDAEWMLLTERTRGLVQATVQPVFRRVTARSHAPWLTTGHRGAVLLDGAGNAARLLSDRLQVLLAGRPETDTAEASSDTPTPRQTRADAKSFE